MQEGYTVEEKNMDCSVKGYLSRRTEAELEAMLRYDITRKDWKSNLQEIILICEEVYKRQKGIPRSSTGECLIFIDVLR